MDRSPQKLPWAVTLSLPAHFLYSPLVVCSHSVSTNDVIITLANDKRFQRLEIGRRGAAREYNSSECWRSLERTHLTINGTSFGGLSVTICELCAYSWLKCTKYIGFSEEEAVLFLREFLWNTNTSTKIWPRLTLRLCQLWIIISSIQIISMGTNVHIYLIYN
jgi:hypothetical protein